MGSWKVFAWMVTGLAVSVSSASAQPKQEGSKLFPEVFDATWTPPAKAPATKPASGAPSDPPTPATVAPEVAVAPSAPALRDIPAAEAQAESRKLMKQLYAAQLADKTLAGRQKLATLLLTDADRYRDQAVDRYVVLNAAVQAGRDLGDLAFVTRAVDVLAADYKVDALKAKAQVGAEMDFHLGSPEQATDNLRKGLALVDELAATGDFETAEQLLKAMQAAPYDGPERDELTQKGRDLETRRTADRISGVEKQLISNPNDAAALLLVGKHRCFAAGDWESGVPLLARCNDAALRTAAVADLKAARDATTAEQAGHAWWSASEAKGIADDSKAAMRHRAGDWYRKAMASGHAAGLSRALVEKRLAELPPPAQPPVAVAPAPGAPMPAAPRVAGGPATTLQMDNDRAEVIGNWKPAQFERGKPRYIGDNYLSDDQAEKGTGTVRLAIPVAVGGKYDVRVSYVERESRSPAVPVTVSGHTGGKATVKIDQTQKPTLNTFFVSAGAYHFAAGATAVVEISNAGTTGTVIVDAVELEPVR